MLSLVFVVGSGHVSTFFTCTEAQEFKSDIDVRNRTRQCALGPILRTDFFPSETCRVTSTDTLEVIAGHISAI